MASAVVIPIPNEEEDAPNPKLATNYTPKRPTVNVSPLSSAFVSNDKIRRVVHSVKVGAALVLVTLLYLLDPLYSRFQDNAMWAIMTVVVMFEFYAGATLSKGLNRGAGTILGGSLGCLVAGIAHDAGGVGNCVSISISVFMLGAAATYVRSVPSIKQKYDYGVMIFILTFNLVVVSGTRTETVIELARDRLATIAIGFGVCIFISLLVFPIWASDELHRNLASEFDELASCVEGLFEKDTSIDGCKRVLYSKPKDESLANFAKWEPWHGRFGASYPWDKYLQIGEGLRELATIMLTLRAATIEDSAKEPWATVGCTVACGLRELGDSLANMKRRGPQKEPVLQSVKLELNGVSETESGQRANVGSSMLLITCVLDKVQVLAKQVDELAKVARFPPE